MNEGLGELRVSQTLFYNFNMNFRKILKTIKGYGEAKKILKEINPDIVKYNRKIIETILIQGFCKTKHKEGSKEYKKLLELAFEKVGYNKDVIKKRFKSLYNAFQYGAPPHGGMAPGIDRIIMLLNDVDNLREIQAFPTSASGQDNLMGSPSEVEEQQLRELHIKVREQNVQNKIID